MTTIVENTLRALDAADPQASASSSRARADLASILGTSRASDLGRRDGRQRMAVRVITGAAAVAAATAGVFVAVPAVTGGDRAFASWTATPTGLTAAEAGQAAAECRQAMLDGAGADDATRLAAAKPAVAEQRGDWTTVILASADGFAATCITDESTRLFRDMFGSIGAPANYVAPERRAIEITDLGSGTARAGDLSLAAGITGADVMGVTYHSASEGDVAATVSGGRFALWFPGSELESAPRDGIELTVTYADGQKTDVRASLGHDYQAPAAAGDHRR